MKSHDLNQMKVFFSKNFFQLAICKSLGVNVAAVFSTEMWIEEMSRCTHRMRWIEFGNLVSLPF